MPEFDSHHALASRSRLIDSLVEDLAPVRVARSWRSAVLLWLGLSWVFVTSAVLLTGPLRTSAASVFTQSPSALLEFALGLAAGLTAIIAGLEMGVPGTPHTRRLFVLPAVLMAGWVGMIVYAMSNPSFEVSMLGKREHCFIESMVFATPPYFLALWLLRERMPQFQAGAVLLTGAAAGAIPALWMQLACMNDPLHALQFHLTPILATAVAGALIGHFAFRK